MRTLALAQVCDLDCVIPMAARADGLSTLVLDVPSPVKYARGVAAILRRVLYRWCRTGPRGITRPLTALEGTRWDLNGLARYRGELEGAARATDYVRGATVPLTLTSGGRLIIAARIDLIDGLTYALEVATVDAPAAILALGGQR